MKRMKASECQRFRDLAERYAVASFIPSDPIQFPHRYVRKSDIEISAVLTAWMTFGNRKAIIRKCEEMDGLFEKDPTAYIRSGKWMRFEGSARCWYRTLRERDYFDMCRVLHDVYAQSDSLEERIGSTYNKGIQTPVEAISLPFQGIAGVPDPAKGSACKRICMLLRWLVRKDEVDFGIWTLFSPRDLIVPLDTHVRQSAANLQMTHRKAADMKAAVEITERLREVFPDDPVRGDFVLFGLDQEKAMEKNGFI